MTTTVRNDENNLYSWDRIETTYDGALLVARFVEYDDGRITDIAYDAGVRARMVQIDGTDGIGVKNWDMIETFYDPAGQLEARLTAYDNGIFKEELFQDGVRSKTVQLDNRGSFGEAGAAAWSSIETFYDQSGNVEAKITFYDDGVVKEELFQNGVRSKTTQVDNPHREGSDGAKTWDHIETFYDQNGKVEAKITFYDDGVVKEELFQDGVRTKITQMDDPQYGGEGTKSWERIETFYDQNGSLEAKVFFFDNGVVREDRFTEGVRTKITQIDDAQYGGAGVKAWQQIETYYDQDGKLDYRATIYDDGRVREEDFEAGQRLTTVTVDNPMHSADGAYNWSEMFKTYDADGNVEADVIIFDNGDAEGDFYMDGVIEQTLEYDGDGSENWLGRMTTYNDDGAVNMVTEFQTEAELPPEFGFGYDIVGY